MMRKKSDDAVSPVVGVMLMVVITVVVAGVIAAFGTGIAGDTEKAPSVVLDVKILSNFKSLEEMTTGGSLNGPDFHILQTSGDPLDTGEIEIQMAWTASDGEHYSTYSAAENKARGNDPQMYVKSSDNIPGDRNNEYGSGGNNHYFGDVVLTPGLRLFAFSDSLTVDWTEEGAESATHNHVGSPFMDKIFNNGVSMGGSQTNPGIMQYLLPGTPVEITILHIPTNTIIYEKEVVVQ